MYNIIYAPKYSHDIAWTAQDGFGQSDNVAWISDNTLDEVHCV